MFIFIKYDGYYGMHEYILTDSDFVVRFFSKIPLEPVMIVEEYEKRNLNVAANLALWVKYRKCYFAENFRSYLNNVQYLNPEKIDRIRDKYLKDVEKYLLLL